MDSEETLPALLDERGVMRFTVPGITLDDGPMEGAPVLELIEHSVLGKSLDSEPKVGMPVLEPLEHSVLAIIMHDEPMEGAPVLEPLEHSVLEKPLDGGPLKGISVMELFEYLVLEAFGSGDDVGRSTFDGIVGVGAVGAFGPYCDRSRRS